MVRRANLGYLRNIKSSKIKLNKEKKDYQMWEEPEAGKELEKIEKQKEEEAKEKEAEKAKEEEELEKKFEQAQAGHSDGANTKIEESEIPQKN